MSQNKTTTTTRKLFLFKHVDSRYRWTLKDFDFEDNSFLNALVFNFVLQQWHTIENFKAYAIANPKRVTAKDYYGKI